MSESSFKTFIQSHACKNIDVYMCKYSATVRAYIHYIYVYHVHHTLQCNSSYIRNTIYYSVTARVYIYVYYTPCIYCNSLCMYTPHHIHVLQCNSSCVYACTTCIPYTVKPFQTGPLESGTLSTLDMSFVLLSILAMRIQPA